RSGKFKEMFRQIAIFNYGTSRAVKPLVRLDALLDTMPSALSSHNMTFLTSLEEMAESNCPSAAPANGLQHQFMEGNTALGHVVAESEIRGLECLSTSSSSSSLFIQGELTEHRALLQQCPD